MSWRSMAAFMRANARPDTAAQIEWRLKDRIAREQARDETRAKYPVITRENFHEVVSFQERRIAELLAQA